MGDLPSASTGLLVMIKTCLAKMDSWWAKHEDSIGFHHSQEVSAIYDSDDAGLHRSSAVMVALFHSVQVRLLSLLQDHKDDGIEQRHLEGSDAVIAAASYVSRQFNHHARIQVTIPTLVVALHGASAEQRGRASLLLEEYEAGESTGDPVAVHRARQLLIATL